MKKLQVICMIILCVCLMGGCKNAIPEMDDETRKLVVEYAAATVRKYNEYQPSKLLEKKEEVSEETIEDEIVVPKQEEREEVTSETITSDTEDSSLEPDSSVEVLEKEEQEPQLMPETLETYYGLENMTLAYDGYEVKDSYPDSGEDMYFIMDATEGMQLLVMKFKMQNNAQSDQMVDFIQKGIRYKIDINGERKNALTTMLLNDLSNYQENVTAGEVKELVLVCEIPIEQASQISSLSLILKNADETATILLK